MAEDREWLVPLSPVRNADRRAAPGRPSLSFPHGNRVAELRRRALDGYYASDAMMDVVAARLLLSGDL